MHAGGCCVWSELLGGTKNGRGKHTHRSSGHLRGHGVWIAAILSTLAEALLFRAAICEQRAVSTSDFSRSPTTPARHHGKASMHGKSRVAPESFGANESGRGRGRVALIAQDELGGANDVGHDFCKQSFPASRSCKSRRSSLWTPPVRTSFHGGGHSGAGGDFLPQIVQWLGGVGARLQLVRILTFLSTLCSWLCEKMLLPLIRPFQFEKQNTQRFMCLCTLSCFFFRVHACEYFSG